MGFPHPTRSALGEPSALRAGRLRCGVMCASLLVLGVAGCAPEIRWRGYVFDPVFADAQRDRKLTLAYLRNWYLPECTDLENNVLKDPQVIEATGDMYCALLEYDWAKGLADDWGITEPPAIVILHPDGYVLERLRHPISLSIVLEAMQRAKAVFAPASRAASSGAPP